MPAPSLRALFNTAPALILAASSSVLLLDGCATHAEVRSIASDVPQNVYELRGTQLNELEAEARKLCPGGYDAPRKWQQGARYANGTGTNTPWLARWLDRGGDILMDEKREAQMTIVCRPIAAAGAGSS